MSLHLPKYHIVGNQMSWLKCDCKLIKSLEYNVAFFYIINEEAVDNFSKVLDK